MAISVVMPALEMAQETGKLVAWLKKEGDSVAKGDLLLEIETDKAVMEVEATADGVLAGVVGEAGSDIPVGQTIAWILNPGEAVPTDVSAEGAVTESVIDMHAPQSQEKHSVSASSSARVSPKARRLAKEAGIDLNSVHGSGQDGEILASDIQALVDAGPKASRVIEADQHQPLSAVARLMAERTTQSWTTVPHFFLQREIDATALNAARAAHGSAADRTHGVKLTHTDILIALVAHTLARHPSINASWVDNGIHLNKEVTIALAMAIDDGVAAPVVRNAVSLSLGEIAHQRRELTDRARAGRLRPNDLAGGTFTISNLGMFHIDSFCAIITPPQAAILAVGQITERVIAMDSVATVRPMLSLTISCDHRVIDGAKGALFLRDLAQAMQEPERWLK
jgi:pyruvate dehydrogenase E2 component (dihydrolipoamide acetyltransferase)